MTLDTKALEAAVRTARRTLRFSHLKGTSYKEVAKEIIASHNATRSQSLPDELKAIADRHDWAWQVWHDQKVLLSHIQDIRRDTAREIVEAIEKRADASIGSISTCVLRDLAASIRTAYGVEG